MRSFCYGRSHIIIILLLLLHHSLELFTSALADGFSLESEWQQVSRTLLSILANISNAVVWRVSAHPLISNFSRPLSNPLGIVPSVPITIGIIATYMFSFLARSKFLSLFLFSLIFTEWSAGMAKTIIRQILFC